MAIFNVVILLNGLMLFFATAAQNYDSVCETGADAINREHQDIGEEYAAVMSTQTWDCDGPVVEWQYFTFRANYVNLIAFTRVDNISTNWMVVGFNNISVQSGYGSYKVPEDERFMVEAGNAIGFSGSDVKWSTGDGLTYINRFSDMRENLKVGDVYEMRWPKPENRTYSLNGTIEKPQISFDHSSATVVEGMILNVTFTNVGEYNHTFMVSTLDGEAISGIDYEQQNKSFTLSGGEQAIFHLQTIGKDICGSETKSLTLLFYWNAKQINWTDTNQMTVTISSAVPCGLSEAAKIGIAIASVFAAIVLFVAGFFVVIIARKIYNEKHRFRRLEEEEQEDEEEEKGGTKEHSGLLNNGSINTK